MGTLHASFRLHADVLTDFITIFPDEADAVRSFVDLINNMRTTIWTFWPRAFQDLMTRHRNLRRAPPQERQTILDLDSALDSALKKSRKQLRAERRRGDRGQDRLPREKPTNRIPAHQKTHKVVISAIERICDLPEEKQEKLNSRKKIAKEAGISYDTLRRAERAGNWSTQDLIVKIRSRRARLATKK